MAQAEICPKCSSPILIGDWPICEPGGGHKPASSGRAQKFDPVVVHVDKQGNVRFPGRADARVPKGYQRRELTTIGEIRRFESQVNSRERSRFSQLKEAEERFYSDVDSQNRSDLLHAMRSMSPLGRAIAQAAINKSNRRSQPSFEPGFCVEVFSYDTPQYDA
jgi:hypothetical protein